MAHELETGYFARQPAWHGLGTVVDQPMTSDGVLLVAGLDWEVQLESMYLAGERGRQGPEIPRFRACVRQSDRAVLGAGMRDNFKPLQNKEAFNFLDSLVTNGRLRYEAAGSLRGGQIVWLLGILEEDGYRVKGVDAIFPYILARNSHDGNSSFRVVPTCVRVVCANTLALAMNQGRGQGISIQHSGDMSRKLKNAENVLRIVTETFKEFTEQAELLAETKVTDEIVMKFVDALFPLPDSGEDNAPRTVAAREALLSEFDKGDGVKEVKALDHTAWGLFNAVTRYTNHMQPVKLGKDVESNDQAIREGRFSSLLFDTGNKRNQEALTWLVTLAKGGDPSNIQTLV